MTAERIAYFEKVLSKPQPEPFKSWLEELFNEAKGNEKPQKAAYQRRPLVVDTPETTDA